MNSDKEISIVNAFNNCINNQDIKGLSALMTENHSFIDRDGTSHGPKSYMIDGWTRFFKSFPQYRNTFERIANNGDLICILGYAYWTEDYPYDPVIWTAVIEDQMISEWRVYEDSSEHRALFNL